MDQDGGTCEGKRLTEKNSVSWKRLGIAGSNGVDERLIRLWGLSANSSDSGTVTDNSIAIDGQPWRSLRRDENAKLLMSTGKKSAKIQPTGTRKHHGH